MSISLKLLNKSLIFSGLYLFILCFNAQNGFAQAPKAAQPPKVKLQGRIAIDVMGKTAIGATIVLLKDSLEGNYAVVTGGQADENGAFELTVDTGRYQLVVSMIGYLTDTQVVRLTVDGFAMPTVLLIENSSLLNTVLIAEDAVRSLQKGDTTEFNSSRYTTTVTATSKELVDKLPGVSIAGGSITVNGQKVDEVLVDGKPFLGSSDGTLQNLPAEAVDKIQIYDTKTDEESATGIKGDQTTKTINLVTKAAFRKSVFGKFGGGAGKAADGTRTLYEGQTVLHSFMDKRRISLVGISANTGESNFDWDDLQGFENEPFELNNGDFAYFGGGGGILGESGSGIPRRHTGGITFREDLTKKNSIIATYSVSDVRSQVRESLLRRYTALGDSAVTYSQLDSSVSTNLLHSASLRWEMGSDTLRGRWVTKGSLLSKRPQAQRSLFSQNQVETRGVTGLSQNTTLSDGNALSGSGTVEFTKSSGLKPKHYFTTSLTLGGGRTAGDNTQDAVQSDLDSNQVLRTTAFRQTRDQVSTNQNVKLRTSYNWRIDTTYSMRTYLSFAGEQSDFTLNTQRSDINNESYAFDSSLSSLVEKGIGKANAGINLSKKTKQGTLVAGIGGQRTDLSANQTLPFALDIQRTFYAALPSLRFYSTKILGKESYSSINYSTGGIVPALEQLRQVPDNTNPLQIELGNPKLRQGYGHNINSYVSKSNPEKERSTSMYVSVTHNRNPVARSTVFVQNDTTLEGGFVVQEGATLRQAVNLNSSADGYMYVSHSRPSKALKSELTYSGNISYNSTPSLINNRLNQQTSLGVNGGIALSSDISDSLDFSLDLSPGYNFVNNSLTKSQNQGYANGRFSAEFKYIVRKWVIESENEGTFYFGEGFENQNVLLWNARLGRKIFKDNRGEIHCEIHDILNRNRSIDRTVTDAYIEDTQGQVLQRYLMFRFTYQLKALTGNTDGLPPGVIMIR